MSTTHTTYALEQNRIVPVKMRADAFEAGTALESASSLPMSDTSTCAGNVQRPAFLDVVTSGDDDNKNDEEKDYKPLYLRSEMLRTEALLNEFWAEEASRKLRIALIHKDVQLYQQQHKMKRILQSQSIIPVESSTSSAASSTSTSSQTELVNKTSKETQTDLHEEEQNEKSSTVNNREDEEDKDTASEMATEETSNDESSPTSNADLVIETELNGDKDTKEEEIDNELICDGKQESQEPAKEETKEQCPQGTDEEDQDADQEEQESKSKEASTPSIAMDSPDFMSKIAMRFKALDDDECINETTASPQADVADEPMSKDDTEGQLRVIMMFQLGVKMTPRSRIAIMRETMTPMKQR